MRKLLLFLVCLFMVGCNLISCCDRKEETEIDFMGVVQETEFKDKVTLWQTEYKNDCTMLKNIISYDEERVLLCKQFIYDNRNRNKDIYLLNDIRVFVHSIIKKVDDPYDIWCSPLIILETGEGDCEEFATLTFYLMECFGFPTTFRIGTLYSDYGWHIVVIYYLDGDDFYIVDSSYVFKEIVRYSSVYKVWQIKQSFDTSYEYLHRN